MEKEYIVISVNFKGNNIEISAEFHHPNLVVVSEFSPPRYNSPNQNLFTVTSRMEVEDFVNDLETIFINLTNWGTLEPKDVIRATIVAAHEHLNQYRRMVIDDLHLYVDLATLLNKNIDTHKGNVYSISHYHDYWRSAEKEFLAEFEEWVWVVSPIGDRLIKYKSNK